jgi:hypothetical protein
MSSERSGGDVVEAAAHLVQAEGRRLLRVAPAVGEEHFNAVRLPLVATACWRLADAAFAFDSSFPGPISASAFQRLATLRQEHPGCLASLFAHADPVGSDEVNKRLSDRRARAVHALLTRKVDAWEALYTSPSDGDEWGVRSLQTMLATLARGDSAAYYGGTIDGQVGPATTTAVHDFQRDQGLTVDSQAGPITRRALYGTYMDRLCADASGTPYQLAPDDLPPDRLVHLYRWFGTADGQEHFRNWSQTGVPDRLPAP